MRVTAHGETAGGVDAKGARGSVQQGLLALPEWPHRRALRGMSMSANWHQSMAGISLARNPCSPCGLWLVGWYVGVLRPACPLPTWL